MWKRTRTNKQMQQMLKSSNKKMINKHRATNKLHLKIKRNRSRVLPQISNNKIALITSNKPRRGRTVERGHLRATSKMMINRRHHLLQIPLLHRNKNNKKKRNRRSKSRKLLIVMMRQLPVRTHNKSNSNNRISLIHHNRIKIRHHLLIRKLPIINNLNKSNSWTPLREQRTRWMSLRIILPVASKTSSLYPT